MNENKTVIKGGISGSTLLGIAFVVLKLVGVIDWAWVWVLAPFWIPIALVIAIWVIFLLLMGIINIHRRLRIINIRRRLK